MKLKSLRIDGFGALTEREFEISPGLTLVVGPNEAGKSTLQKCLLALLYGLSRRGEGPGRPVETSEWAFLRPWDQTARYGASVFFALKSGQEVYVSKDFSEQDSTKTQVVAGGKDITKTFKRDKDTKDLKIGEHFLGLSREEFEASALIKQYGVRWEDGTCKLLASQIEALVDTGGKESASEAIRILEQAISEKIGTDRSTKRPLDQVRGALREKQRELQECEAVHSEAMNLWRGIDELGVRLDQANKEVEKYEGLTRLGELIELEEKVKRIREVEKEVKELRQRLENLGPVPSADIDVADLTRRLEEYERSAGELQQIQSQLDEARPALSKATNELCGIAGGLWEELVELQLLEGVPPETAGLEPDKLREAMDETDAALRNGIDAEEKRQSEIKSKLRKEQLRRAVTSGFVSLFGVLVLFLGVLGEKSAAIIGGVLLLVAGVGGLVSLPLLRRSYRRAFSKLPDLEEMRDKLDEFRRVRTGVDSQMGWVVKLLPRERKLHDGKTEAEADLEDFLRRAGAKGNTLEELKKAHTQLQDHRREYESAEARLKEAKKRLAGLEDRGGAEELMGRIEEKRRSLSAIDELRGQYRDGEDYIEKERAAREDAGKLEAELEGLRGKAQAMLKCTTPPGKLRSEIARLRADEAKLLRFRESLDTARNVLASVVEDTHARWSASLNQSASEIVERLTQARYSRVVFDNDLSPTLERPDGRQIMEGQALRECLSEGTQDLLYFAARVTVARELSSSREPLPLILDDPLVALDKNRLQAALSLLAKMARQVQVIILTCREGYRTELESLSQREGTDFAYIHLA